MKWHIGFVHAGKNLMPYLIENFATNYSVGLNNEGNMQCLHNQSCWLYFEWNKEKQLQYKICKKLFKNMFDKHMEFVHKGKKPFG